MACRSFFFSLIAAEHRVVHVEGEVGDIGIGCQDEPDAVRLHLRGEVAAGADRLLVILSLHGPAIEVALQEHVPAGHGLAQQVEDHPVCERQRLSRVLEKPRLTISGQPFRGIRLPKKFGFRSRTIRCFFDHSLITSGPQPTGWRGYSS